MSKADVTALVGAYSFSRQDITQTSDYYDEIVRELAFANWLVNVSLITASEQNTAIYSLPNRGVRVLAAFYDDLQLSLETERSLLAIDPDWRNRNGAPIAYTQENEDATQIAVYPTPAEPSKDFSFSLGEPLGRDFPAYAVAMMHSETRDDLPEWAELPIMLEICAREFNRESDHKDQAFALACSRISALLLLLIRPRGEI